MYKYRLYVWISDEVTIGNLDGVSYTMEEWANLYANIRVNVNGRYINAENFTNKIKNKLGTEGLVAVNTDGELYDGTGEIREYRYSGMGNYCIYTDGENDYNLTVEDNTCPQTACLSNSLDLLYVNSDTFIINENSCPNDSIINLKVENSTPTDTGIRNYVEFNGELWRIVGVFDNNIKIVKNIPLTNDIYNSETYTSGNTTYKFKYLIEAFKYGYFKYNELADNTYNNDWTTSGAMHFLNDKIGNSYYVNNLSSAAKGMIEESTFYLGNVSFSSLVASDYYKEERGNEVCSSNVVENSHEANCNIWDGNQASWNGNLGFLYPSDYMYSLVPNVWDMSAITDFSQINEAISSTWLYNSNIFLYWFISPSSVSRYYATYAGPSEKMGSYYANYAGSLRPSLYLKADVMVISGDGSYNSPYKLLES